MNDLLFRKWQALADGETDFEANCAQFVALIYQEMEDVSWVGFYWNKNGFLVVGAYQGPVACSRFPNDQGVCGAAFQRAETVIVSNVHEFSGHIACDPKSQSEIVVPLRTKSNHVIGVLDLDSYSLDRFTESDRTTLEKLVDDFSVRTHWPDWACK